MTGPEKDCSPTQTEKRAFLVIVEYANDLPAGSPCIGDISWALRDKFEDDRLGWNIHTTEATAKMLAHHGVPYPIGANHE